MGLAAPGRRRAKVSLAGRVVRVQVDVQVRVAAPVEARVRARVDAQPAALDRDSVKVARGMTARPKRRLRGVCRLASPQLQLRR